MILNLKAKDRSRLWLLSLCMVRWEVQILLADSSEKVELIEAKVESLATNVEVIHGKVEEISQKVESANFISGFP